MKAESAVCAILRISSFISACVLDSSNSSCEHVFLFVQVFSLKSMVVFYRHKCGMTGHMHEQPTALADREDHAVFPCQRDDFEICNEVSLEDKDTHLVCKAA